MGLAFEWDPRKAAANLRKHGVSFDEASSVFLDDLSVTVPDPDHSDEEERWVTLGISHRQRLLVVVHADRQEPNRVRLISARVADVGERREYEEGEQGRN